MDQASFKDRFAPFGGPRRRLGDWLLLAVVLGGTHVSLAQHRQSSITNLKHSESGRLGAEQWVSDERNENWTAQPSCFDQATGMVGRAPVSRTWVLMSPDGLYGAYAVNERLLRDQQTARFLDVRARPNCLWPHMGMKKPRRFW
jgi:hypothetical protein